MTRMSSLFVWTDGDVEDYCGGEELGPEVFSMHMGFRSPMQRASCSSAASMAVKMSDEHFPTLPERIPSDRTWRSMLFRVPDSCECVFWALTLRFVYKSPSSARR